MREVSRERLVVEGNRRLHIQPLVLEPNSRGDVLLAGALNHMFEPAPGGGWAHVAADTVLGAVIPRSGPARIVPSPIHSKLLDGIQAVARADGTWAVVFGEMSPHSEDARPDTISRLWFGILDGSQWTSLQRIPLPPSGSLRGNIMSRLVQYGDTLAFAMRLTSASQRRNVIIFEHSRGGWSHDIIPTLVGSYLALAHSGTTGLVLATVQPDLALRSDGNSLLLWNRGATWRKVRTVVPSSGGDVHRPNITITSKGGVLGWVAAVRGRHGIRYEARAMVGQIEEKNEPVVHLDSSVTRLRGPYLAELQPGLAVWVLDHLESDGGQREIRFVRRTDASAAAIGRLPNPYAAAFAVVVQPENTLLLVGGHVDTPQQSVASLLIRAQVVCPAPATQ